MTMSRQSVVADELEKLAGLRDRGYLTDSEFADQRGAFEAGLNGEDFYADELLALASRVDAGELTFDAFRVAKSDYLWHAVDEPVAALSAVSPGWEWVLVAAGVFVTLGAFLPWETANTGLVTLSRNGFQLGKDLSFSWDGMWLLLLGVATALVGAARLSDRPLPHWLGRSSQVVDGAIVLFITIANKSSISSMVHSLQRQDPAGVFAVGYGLWLAVIGGAAILLSGLVGWWHSRQEVRLRR